MLVCVHVCVCACIRACVCASRVFERSGVELVDEVGGHRRLVESSWNDRCGDSYRGLRADDAAGCDWALGLLALSISSLSLSISLSLSLALALSRSLSLSLSLSFFLSFFLYLSICLSSIYLSISPLLSSLSRPRSLSLSPLSPSLARSLSLSLCLVCLPTGPRPCASFHSCGWSFLLCVSVVSCDRIFVCVCVGGWVGVSVV